MDADEPSANAIVALVVSSIPSDGHIHLRSNRNWLTKQCPHPVNRVTTEIHQGAAAEVGPIPDVVLRNAGDVEDGLDFDRGLQSRDLLDH